MKKLFTLVTLLVGVVTNTFAATPDFTPITNAVDFTTVITGILAVGVAVAGVYIAVRGALLLLSFIENNEEFNIWRYNLDREQYYKDKWRNSQR